MRPHPALALLLLAACPEPERPPEPITCPAGKRPGPGGAACEPILPAGACPGGTFAVLGEAECVPVGPAAVPPGFVAAKDGWGWEPVLPEAECPPGTRRALGRSECVPVGWRECGEGFEPDASGWGCSPVLPAGPCQGATRAALGATACVPLGDCAAPFPPAAATHFVGDEFSGRANHFFSIQAALDAAESGAVIAVGAGTYPGALRFKRPARIVGRCPASVIIEAPFTARAVGVSTLKGCGLSGVTVRGGDLGIAAWQKGEILLEDVLIEGTRGSGLIADSPGARIEARRVAVRSPVPKPGNTEGRCASAERGGEVVLDQVELSRCTGSGLTSAGAGSLLRATGLAVLGVLRQAGGDFGFAGRAQEGGRIELRRVAAVGNVGGGFYAMNPDSSLLIEDFAMRDPIPDARGAANGLGVYKQATATLTRASLEGSLLAAIQVGLSAQVEATQVVASGTHLLPGAKEYPVVMSAQAASTVRLSDSAFVDNRAGGAFSEDADSRIELSGVAILGCDLPDFAPCVRANLGAAAVLTDCTLSRCRSTGLLAEGEESSASASRCLIEDVSAPPAQYAGAGVAVFPGASATLEDSLVAGSPLYGVANSGRVTLRRTSVRGTLSKGALGRASGLLSVDGGSAVAEDCELAFNQVNGARSLGGASLSLRRTLVRDTLPDPDGAYGMGLLAGQGASLSMSDSAVVRSRTVGVYLALEHDDPRPLQRSLIAQTAPAEDSGLFGYGLLLEGAFARLQEVEVRDSAQVGAVFSSSRATCARCLVRDNAVGVHAQDGSAVGVRASLPELPEAGAVLLSEDSVLSGNATDWGTGSVPLPSLE